MSKGLLYRQFNYNGFIHLKNVFSKGDVEIFNSSAKRLSNLPEVRYQYMKYYETCNKTNERILARMENFVNNNEFTILNRIINLKVTPIVEEVIEKRMVIFKDKINWKLPGGGGFEPHQDHDAWSDFPLTKFITAAIFIDNSTLENGCLQVAENMHTSGILPNNNGCISNEITDNFHWIPLITSPTDLVLFDSYTPHMSKLNNSDKSRRAFYLTYNLRDEGNFYSEYFKKKRIEFPPDFERDNTKININSKYNLANPIN